MQIAKCKLQNQRVGHRPSITRGVLQFAFCILHFAICNAFTPAARAAADLDKPYKVQLVLRFGENRQLTDAFKDKVEHELNDSLQAALGEMGQVSVVHEHPKLKELEEKGLQVLDAWREVDGLKTHFVFIDLRDGEYEIRARQHDGYTGQASHLRKPERVADRQLVARTAALLIERDFGIVGAVKPINAESVQVRFLAGGFDDSLTHWVKKGDIFAVIQINEAAAMASRVPWTLLQAQDDPKQGECVCRLLRGEPSPLPDEQSYRCIKLGTTRAPLQVRILKYGAKTPTPVQNLQIHVRRSSFKQEEAFEQGITNAQGLFETAPRKIVYDQVAFVSCLSNNVVRYQEPIPIFGDEPYDCKVKISDDPRDRLAFDREVWERLMYEADRRQVGLFSELFKADPEKRQATLEKAQKGLEDLDRDLDQFERKRKELLDLKMDRSAGQSRLNDLHEKREKLKAFIATQEALVKEEKDPTRQKILQLVKQAQLREADAEFGAALELYRELNELIVKAGLKDPKLDDYVKHIKKLEADWAIKSPEHEAARKYIYETWPNLDTDELKRGIPLAREKLEVCRKAGDKLSPQKLAKVALAHDGKLKQKKAELNPDLNTDDVKQAMTIDAVLEDLAKLLEQVNEVLKQSAPPAK